MAGQVTGYSPSDKVCLPVPDRFAAVGPVVGEPVVESVGAVTGRKAVADGVGFDLFSRFSPREMFRLFLGRIRRKTKSFSFAALGNLNGFTFYWIYLCVHVVNG